MLYRRYSRVSGFRNQADPCRQWADLDYLPFLTTFFLGSESSCLDCYFYLLLETGLLLRQLACKYQGCLAHLSSML